jgi:predicted nucleic acid-binding Zn ribbon protein
LPIYDMACDGCKVIEEHVCSFEALSRIKCKSCGNPTRQMVSLIAKTPGLWDAGWREGLSGSGKYDAGLGMTIQNERQRQKELDKRGWIRESDLEDGWWDKSKSKIKEDNAAIDAKAIEYKANVEKFDGDKEKAITETWSAKDCLAGHYD